MRTRVVANVREHFTRKLPFLVFFSDVAFNVFQAALNPQIGTACDIFFMLFELWAIFLTTSRLPNIPSWDFYCLWYME